MRIVHPHKPYQRPDLSDQLAGQDFCVLEYRRRFIARRCGVSRATVEAVIGIVFSDGERRR